MAQQRVIIMNNPQTNYVPTPIPFVNREEQICAHSTKEQFLKHAMNLASIQSSPPLVQGAMITDQGAIAANKLNQQYERVIKTVNSNYETELASRWIRAIHPKLVSKLDKYLSVIHNNSLTLQQEFEALHLIMCNVETEVDHPIDKAKIAGAIGIGQYDPSQFKDLLPEVSKRLEMIDSLIGDFFHKDERVNASVRLAADELAGSVYNAESFEVQVAVDLINRRLLWVKDQTGMMA